MKKHLTMLALAILATSFAACSNSDSPDGSDSSQNSGNLVKQVKSALTRQTPNIPDADFQKNINAQYDLNFNLLRQADSQLKDKNACLSTFSLQSAMAMAWAGSDGTTATEIANALGFDASSHQALNKIQSLFVSHNRDAEESEYESHDAVIASYANDLYLAPGHNWNPEWLDELAKNYDAGVTEMNFAKDPEASRAYINDAVSKATHDRIKDLLPEGTIDTNTVSVLTNATYLKVPWRDSFGIASTPIDFHLSDGSTVQPEYIVTHTHYNYYKADNYQAVTVPLFGNSFDVLFIMPDAGSLADVQSTLNAQEINQIFNGLAFKDIHLFIPSIKFETSWNVKKILSDMGMNAPFDQSTANFSRMTTDPNDFYLSAILQKTFIAMDKHGVEGAAATAIVAASESMEMEPPLELKIDNPYFFIIYEKESKSPIFFARVLDPTK